MSRTNRDIALTYLDRFCSADVDGIAPLLAPELKFTGTLHSYSSSSEYVAALRDDPPVEARYNIIGITEDANSVAVFYDYRKPNHTMRMAQQFKIRNQKICEIILVFDGRGFG